MRHHPTSQDAVADLRRCIYASFTKEGFHDPNVIDFYNHALGIIEKIKASLQDDVLEVIQKCLERASSTDSPPAKRREDLLTASIILQSVVSKKGS